MNPINIFYQSSIDKRGYKSKKKNIPNIPNRDYQTHAKKLLKYLKEIEESQEKEIIVKNGEIYDFIGATNSILTASELVAKKANIKVLNCETIIDGENKYEKATVYIPTSQKKFFETKINDYLQSNGKKKKKLINSIEKIKQATLKSFWIDDYNKIPNEIKKWCEIWIEKIEDTDITRIKTDIIALNIEISEQNLAFEERIVFLCKVDYRDLIKLIQKIDFICEIKLNYELSTFYLDEINREEAYEWIEDLKKRIIKTEEKASILLIDTGVNNGHPLISDFLTDKNCNGYYSEKSYDDDGHGTKMAGLALYGDLNLKLQTDFKEEIPFFLQSYRILYPNNDKELYGYMTNEAILTSKDKNTQINCMAIATNEKENTKKGIPTSWSASIDNLAYGDENNINGRLFCLSAGNVTSREIEEIGYPDVNKMTYVEEPGQAWNALTVGCYTEKYLQSKNEEIQEVAPPFGLSPYSKTSIPWSKDSKLIKPEILLEGGNLQKDKYSCAQSDELSLLTTCKNFLNENYFTSFASTSASTALAANMCAKIQAFYPEAWPQTIRGLLIHSASWTNIMISKFLNQDIITKKNYASMLRTCGYGVPELEKALGLIKNSVNLVIQSEMKPFKLNDKKNIIFNELHVHEIPWPKDLLLQLADQNFQIKVTLSYFIEPNPGNAKRVYDYQSYGLRFELSGNRTKDELIRKISKLEESYENDSIQDNWLYGPNARNTGSIHSDIWNGTGADFAESNYVLIYPIGGWWKQKKKAKRYEKTIRYSLIVSITSEKNDIDLFTPIYNKIESENKIKAKLETEALITTTNKK